MLVLELVKLSVEEIKSKCSVKTTSDKCKFSSKVFQTLTHTQLHTGMDSKNLKGLLEGCSEAEIFEKVHQQVATHIASIIKQPTNPVEVIKTSSSTKIVSQADLFFMLETTDDTVSPTVTINCLSNVDLSSLAPEQTIALIHQFINQTASFDELMDFCCKCVWDKKGRFALFLGIDSADSKHKFLM